jgi:hypothetical protein
LSNPGLWIGSKINATIVDWILTDD